MTACHTCKRPTNDETVWLGEAGRDICQDCWEAECDRSWWAMVNAVNDAIEAKQPQ